MEPHRNLYPWGAASNVYRYGGGPVHAFEASITGLSSQGDRGIQSNSLGAWERGRYDAALYNVSGEERHLRPASRFVADDGDFLNAYAKSHADLRNSLRDSEFLTRPYLMDYRAFGGDTMASDRKAALLTDGNSFNLLPAETDIRSYFHVTNENVNISHHDKKVEGLPYNFSQTPARKRKTVSLDEIIRETSELHSLFRTGLAAASNVAENCKNYIIPSGKCDKPSQNTITGELEHSLWDKCILQEPPLDSSWDVAANSRPFDTTSSWSDLSVPTEERKGATSNKKLKESSPCFDLEQEYHCSELQRVASARVVGFIGSYSDDDDSDSEDFEDSEDDAPKIITDSPGDSKTREDEAFDFFLQMFAESNELQKLYREQCHVRRFVCLVCSTIPRKPVKKYNGLVSVVMHASKIIKTKKKQEHRGYARALCATMGWDLCKLPTMPSSLSPHPRCCIPINKEEETAVRQGGIDEGV